MAAELTEHDNAVLNCVFNPSLPLEEASSLVRYENLTGRYIFIHNFVYI